MSARLDITYCSNSECKSKSSCMRSLDNLRSHKSKWLSVSVFNENDYYEYKISKWLSVSVFIPDENDYCEYKIEQEDKED